MMRPLTALVATVLSGVLYALCFPTAGLFWLAWFALVPWLVALRSGSWRRAVVLAWCWSIVAAYGVGDWFPRAVSGYYLQPAWVGAAFFLAVSTLTAAPAYAAFALCWRRLDARPGPLAPLLAAAAWVGAELIRARVLLDPWALLGYSQVPVPALLQVAEATGIYGTSFVVAAMNAALAELWLQRRHPPAARGAMVVALACAVAVAAFGVVRLRLLDHEPAQPGVATAVVQANLDLGSQWRPEFYGRNLGAHLALSADALRHEPAPRLLVWPESAVSFFLDDEPSYRAAIARVLAPAGAELVAGGPRTANGASPPYFNASFLLRADGSIAAWYDKRWLLPFAEYFPFPSLDVLRRNFGRVREFTAGATMPPLPTVAGPAGVVICNEALFAEPAGQRVREGARLLLALANDSWLGEPKYAEQALAMTAVRAVEQRRWLVRASTSGPSAIVNPAGHIAVRSAAFEPAILQGAVSPRDGLTLYARGGDLFAVGCLLVMLVFMGRPSSPRPHREDHRPRPGT